MRKNGKWKTEHILENNHEMIFAVLFVIIISEIIMGQRQTYVRGGGSHRSVPPPIQSKVQLYSSSKRLSSQSSLSGGFVFEGQKNNDGKRKIEWDVKEINE